MATRVEVIARLGDTLLDVQHLADGGYRLAGAPIVELTAQGALARRPDGQARVLVPGERVELPCGLVTVELALVELAPAPLARPAFERRPYAYALAMLVAHLALWAAAVTIAPFVERLPQPRPRPRYVHAPGVAMVVARPEAVILPDPVATPPDNLGHGPHGPRGQGQGHAPSSQRGEGTTSSMFDAIARVARDPGLTDMTAITNGFDPDAGIYDDSAAPGFGRTRQFDPTRDPRFASVAAGRFATTSDGRGAGALYDIGVAPPQPRVRLCATAGCRVTGGIDEREVRIELEQQLAPILRCYVDHAPSAVVGNVVLELEIGEDGRVARALGHGLGGVGPCVAGIASALEFPTAARATRVRYPMTFQPG